jgi:putative restriction endonuclease
LNGATNLELYENKFKKLKTAPNAPHKYCMLLALLDLARAGQFKENAIFYNPDLLDRFASYFAVSAGPRDHANPYFPFFHLSKPLRDGSHSFWHLVPKPGRESILENMGTARSHKDITENIQFVRIDQPLFELLQDDYALAVLSETLAEQLQRGHTELRAMMSHLKTIGDISRYERTLRQTVDPSVCQVQDSSAIPSQSIRDPAFRRVVTQAYDYRCCATGLRLLLPDGAAMVEAAHLVPFSETQDDDPRNGIALTPNMHWALDRNLIAPTPSFTWKISKQIDDRVPDFQELSRLDGRKLFLPSQSTLWPKREALEWRTAQIDS